MNTTRENSFRKYFFLGAWSPQDFLTNLCLRTCPHEPHMPFGRYGPKDYPPYGVPLIDLPPEYLLWFKQRGFPPGRLGELMEIVCEIKGVGADGVFEPLRWARGGRTDLRLRRPRQVGFE